VQTPKSSIDKDPSAELRPDQKDSDSLSEYQRLDAIRFQYIERLKGLREILEMGFNEALVRRVLRMVNINEFKRHQPPLTLEYFLKHLVLVEECPL
jgi:NAD+ synthase (glutamine-hydrolysing)